MIVIKRKAQHITVFENGIEQGTSCSVRGGRILINPSIKDEYIDCEGFTRMAIKKNPLQALMSYFNNLDLSQEIKLINF
jgi:hypothetical protein